jgi:hypothetical protein
MIYLQIKSAECERFLHCCNMHGAGTRAADIHIAARAFSLKVVSLISEEEDGRVNTQDGEAAWSEYGRMSNY